ncbi:hypothetical protein ACIF8W_12830 [Streptomyces sp. NPDC085639]|uniref:hypothetical protein n=1 Tax=Streptomyces sp. NPDC085639 TaxID=3365734 RepID=UPI0037D1E4AE
MFRGCRGRRANPDNDYPRGIYNLVIEDNQSDPGYKLKGSVPLGPGFTGWVLPDKAEATLPAGCAARMGSTAPYISVTLTAPSKVPFRLAGLFANVGGTARSSVTRPTSSSRAGLA